MRSIFASSFVTLALIGLGVASCIGDTAPLSVGPNQPTDGGSNADASPNETDAGSSDAGNDGDPNEVDAGGDASICDLAVPFDSIELLPINTIEDESGATLSSDETQIVFATSGRETLTGGGITGDNTELWVATRNAITEPFTAVSEAWTKGINTPGALDAYPTLSMDARELLWITRPLDEGRQHRLRSSTRLDAKAPFESSTAVKFTSGATVEMEGAYPSVITALPNGALYFSMADPPASPPRFFRAARTGAATYAAPVAEKFLDDDVFGGRPLVPTHDELAAYASRASDIYLLRRKKVTDPWGSGVVVPEINSSSMEYALWLSPDRCRLYFASDRTGGVGKRDLYVAIRHP